jgi:hypothetical protein
MRRTPLIAIAAVVLMAAVPSTHGQRGVRKPVELPPGDALTSGITVRVDPRVELLSIVFRLAGNPEYNRPNSASPYADAVEEWFGPFRDHPAVVMARALRNRDSVSYDAVMSMAIHLTDARGLAERIPFDTPPERLDGRWRAEAAREFVEKLRDFVAETRFQDFVAEHQVRYEVSAARLRTLVHERAYVAWLDSFFGARRSAAFIAIPGLLLGGNCYGAGIRFPDGTEEITPIIGAWSFDDDGMPRYDSNLIETFVHELVHSYTNPLIDAFWEKLEPSGTHIFPTCREIMESQAYGTWRTVLYESLVRACTVRFLLDTEGNMAGLKAIRHHEQRGFLWVKPLAELLFEYTRDRDRYPTMMRFMPRIVAFFDDYAVEVQEAIAMAPRVVSMVPANGATDVDPALTTMTITFDRPMKPGSWSMMEVGPFPEITGRLAFDATGRVLTVPVRLSPGVTYEFRLNSAGRTGFKSREGYALVPLKVTFTTRAE